MPPSRADDTMGELKAMSRHRDERDRRNVLVKRTAVGALGVERVRNLTIEKAAELSL